MSVSSLPALLYFLYHLATWSTHLRAASNYRFACFPCWFYMHSSQQACYSCYPRATVRTRWHFSIRMRHTTAATGSADWFAFSDSDLVSSNGICAHARAPVLNQNQNIMNVVVTERMHISWWKLILTKSLLNVGAIKVGANSMSYDSLYRRRIVT